MKASSRTKERKKERERDKKNIFFLLHQAKQTYPIPNLRKFVNSDHLGFYLLHM